MNATRAFRPLLLVVCCVLLLPSLLSSLVSAEEPTGEEIMRRVEELQGGWEDEVATITFLLIKGEKADATRVVSRKRKTYRGKDGPNRKTLFLLLHPPKLRRFVYLSWSYTKEGRGEDQWYYTPSGVGPGNPLNDEDQKAKKTLRMISNPKDRFLTPIFPGIDFTHADLSDRQVTQDTYRLLRQETYNYKDCYVVESIPRDERYPYSKRIFWIWKDRWLPIKVDHYDRKDKLIRTLFHHYWVKVQGVWLPRQSLMKDHLRKHETLLFINAVQFNVGLTSATFLPATLEYTR